MICPKCKSDTLTEEKDMVVCSNCGFKATISEYNISKHIRKANPQRKIELHENEETYSETYKTIRDFLNDKYIRALVFVILLVIVFIIIASM
jgi:uncharacterized Zn finger protein (UPF0148 family)